MSPDGIEHKDASASVAVDREHPWLGLASFTEETRGYFYGREEEVAELGRRVQRKLLTILFGQSGLGKTSILRAGLVPRLRPEGYCPVYVRVDYAPDTPPPSEQIKQAIFRETQATGAWTQAGVALAGESLWEFLHHRDDVLVDEAGRKLVPILIFDQFEEVFTLAQSDDAGRRRAAEFLADLADLVENRPPRALEEAIERDESLAARFDFARADYRVLIALREDYLAHLEGLKRQMPSITQNRMRLARMTGAQALQAVMRPGGRLVNQEVAESIVRFTAGGSELANAEVEPSLLSLICRELNNTRLAQGRAEISADLLAGSRDTILAEFYERALADVPAGVRQVIEDHLLTESGYRENLAEERLLKLLAAAGAPEGTLAKLVDRRLLRIEERLDVRRVELTHDVLTGVVKASRDVRLEREARDDAERKFEEQRQRARAARQALHKARRIAAGAAVLAALAVASAIYGWFATERAQKAEAKAEQTSLLAEQARGEAEKLVVYLLDDFQLELAPVGRLDIVAGLAKRALDYYNGLPAALRNDQSERNRALALVRYGAALRTQARLAEGTKAIDEAVTVLARLRAAGDRSEMTAIGLALGVSTQARLKSSVDSDADALAVSTRAVEILAGPASAIDASVPLRRAYGEVLMMQGFLEMRSDRVAESIATLDRARAFQRGIAGDAMDDMAAAAAYAESTAWQVQANLQAARTEESQVAAAEVARITERILAQRPGHMQALRAQALATSPLAQALRDEMRLAEALAMADATIRSWREFVRMDRTNAISWSNLSVGHMVRASILDSMGRLGDSAATHRAAMTFEREAPAGNAMLAGGLSMHGGRLAVAEAERGRDREADAALAENARLRKLSTDPLSAGFRKAAFALFDDFWAMRLALSRGEHARVLALGKSLTASLEALDARSGPDQRDRAEWLGAMYQWMVEAAFASREVAAGERAAVRLLELHKDFPVQAVDNRIERADQRAWAALALARAGRGAEAQALAGEALAFRAERAPRAREDYAQRVGHALALYATVVAGAPDVSARLAQARALLDRGPDEARNSRSVVALRTMIAGEQSRRR